MLIVNDIENKTNYSMPELRLCLFSFLAEVILTTLVSSILSVHFSVGLRSANLSAKLFLHSQFL